MQGSYTPYWRVFNIARRVWQVLYAGESERGALRPSRMKCVGDERTARVRLALSERDLPLADRESRSV